MTLAGRRSRRLGGRPPLLEHLFFRRLLFWRRGNRRIAPRPSSPSADADTRRTAGGRGKAGPRTSSVLFALLRVLAASSLAAALGAGAYGVRYFLLHSPHFALREVRISPTRHVSAEALRKRAGLPSGAPSTNLFRLDLAAIKKNLAAEPWLRSVELHRELPGALRIEVREHEPVALISLDSLYLVSDTGQVFKRAAPSEYTSLPVITGFGRAAYLMEPELTHGQIRTALAALSRYQLRPGRPPIGEAHVDRFIGVTLYTSSGVAIRLGQGESAELDTRLLRFDAVWQALARAGQRPLMLFLDNRAHPDHVTVRLAS